MQRISAAVIVLALGASAAAQAAPKPADYYNPRWSPDGHSIVFESTRDGKFAVYTVNADGSNLKRLTSPAANSEQPSWSPDGKRIVYSSDAAGGHLDLYLMNADGTNQTRLTTTPAGGYYQSSFSPDGQWIAFQGREDNALFADKIFVIRTDGSGWQRLTDSTTSSEAPRWSPDGRAIVFTRQPALARTWKDMTPALKKQSDDARASMMMQPDGSGLHQMGMAAPEVHGDLSPDGRARAYGKNDAGAHGIYVQDIVTKTERLVTGGNAAPSPQQGWKPPITGGALPFVSLDGSLISFVAHRSGEHSDLYVIHPDGTGEKQLTHDGSGPGRWLPGGAGLLTEGQTPPGDSVPLLVVGLDGSGPKPFATIAGRGADMSRDGKWLVATVGRPPVMSARLFITARDGSQSHAVTDSGAMAFNAMWSPDGNRIAYARLDTTHVMQMWIMNADGRGKRQITHFSAADGYPQWPSWSPNGVTIAVQAGDYQPPPATNTAHIWLVNVNTGAATKLAAHDKRYLDETPSFFPDGKRIAFQSDRTGRMEIWVMNADGSGARQVTR